MIRFEREVVVVSGAGRGLDRLYALDLARRGASVVVNDLGTTTDGSGADEQVADAVVEEIERAGGRAVASYDSVESPESAAAIVDAAMSRFGRLDAVVSNAGIYQTLEFDQLTPEQWQSIFDEIAQTCERLGLTS